ncbi:MAG: threonine aldolase family protein [Acidimicrobiales bacterium]
MLTPPETSFASDNTAGVAPEILEAIAQVSTGPAIAYGADAATGRLQDRVRDVFGPEATALLAWGGTGANVVSLATLVLPHQGIICPESAHINVDECGSFERFTGSKLLALPTVDGKLTPKHIEDQLHVLGTVHHTQPGAISVTQITEYGTLYTVEELTDLCGTAKSAGLRVHMDGARIANAAAALGRPVSEFTADIGVDVLSFGGTKNGAAYGEAIIYFDPSLVELGRFVQKQAAQLPSKMRFVAAQFEALLTDDLWLRHGRHANDMARLLADAMSEVPGVEITQDVQANAVFAKLPRSVVQQLQEWSFFYVWAPSSETSDPIDEVRWMTSFQTTPECVERFVAGVATAMDGRLT